VAEKSPICAIKVGCQAVSKRFTNTLAVPGFGQVQGEVPRVGVELARGQVGQRPVRQVGYELLYDRVAAVLVFDLGQRRQV
jgi:hypothetical protein